LEQDWSEDVASDIIHAEGVLGWFFIIRAGGAHASAGSVLIALGSVGLRSLVGAFDLLTQIAEIVWINPQAEDFADHGKEVRQGANRAQWYSVSGTDQSPRRGQDEGVFDGDQRHTALLQLGWAARRRSGRRTRPLVPGALR
jgi:hypothetical protein